MAVDIIGIGPGNLSFALPIALKKVEESEVIIGGRRNLRDLDTTGKEVIYIGNNLDEIKSFIQNNYMNKKIAVVVSGDTGFHSILSYLKRNLKNVPLEVTPGISSITYFFSKLQMSWHDACLKSVHGESIDFIKIIKENKKTAFLTDTKITPKYIAKKMNEEGILDKYIYIGENLSYEDEKITKLKVQEAVGYEASDLCVVVISDE